MAAQPPKFFREIPDCPYTQEQGGCNLVLPGITGLALHRVSCYAVLPQYCTIGRTRRRRLFVIVDDYRDVCRDKNNIYYFLVEAIHDNKPKLALFLHHQICSRCGGEGVIRSNSMFEKVLNTMAATVYSPEACIVSHLASLQNVVN